MAEQIRKCLDLAARLEHPSQHLSDPATLFKVKATGTKWIRCWISWARAMPSPGNYDLSYIGLVDSQLSIAKANGLNVVLVTHEFPRWSNGTQNVDPNTHAFADRNQANPGDPPDLKALEQGVPIGQLGAEGYWGQWIHFLIARYQPYGNVILEIMNEPNFAWWPQLNSEGAVTSPCWAAEMMHTAANVNAFYGMYIMAPAISDTRSTRARLYTRYDTFLDVLRTQLSTVNFRGTGHFIWSHHNYKDIEDGNTAGYSKAWDTVAGGGWWLGWRAPGNQPGIWITEGGCRIAEAGGNRQLQADKVYGMYSFMRFASGASMFTNYQLHTVSYFDTGLLHEYSSDTAWALWQKFLDMEAGP